MTTYKIINLETGRILTFRSAKQAMRYCEAHDDYFLDDGYCVKMYLDWVNNFLTVPKFAEYYGISEDEANDVIIVGRYNHELKAKKAKADVDYIKSEVVKLSKISDQICDYAVTFKTDGIFYKELVSIVEAQVKIAYELGKEARK